VPVSQSPWPWRPFRPLWPIICGPSRAFSPPRASFYVLSGPLRLPGNQMRLAKPICNIYAIPEKSVRGGDTTAPWDVMASWHSELPISPAQLLVYIKARLRVTHELGRRGSFPSYHHILLGLLILRLPDHFAQPCHSIRVGVR
jgi:hypothetical protein